MQKSTSIALVRAASVFSLTTALVALPVAAGAEPIRFTIDAKRDVKPISRFIYGVNEHPIGGAFPNLTFRRTGGNRWTAYNWENNASNAGSDYIFQNDNYLGGGNTPGGAVIPAIENAAAHHAGILLTIPTLGYVAADKNPPGDVRDTPNYLQTRFRQGKPRKGAPFTLMPNVNDAFVYQDEFVNWVKTKYPYGQAARLRPIWFSLDNEPDLWAETHLAIHRAKATYAEMVQKATSYAKAIKAVMPETLVFGPVNYGFAGYVRLQDAPDNNGRDFQEFYLRQMKQAEADAGKRLLDVLDVHWYPEAEGGGVRVTSQSTEPAVVAARLQAPRSLFDPDYKEDSWITRDHLHAPINLLNRLKGKIAANYPGTRLAVTEYNYGAGQHISGGIAQADVLGIFGRERVFAANWFPLWPNEIYVQGAFRMFRDFDGNSGAFGDTSIRATTEDIARSSVYASLDSGNPGRMTIVAINKTAQPLQTVIRLVNARPMKRARVYQLTGASPLPKAKPTITMANPARLTYTMPAYSVSTLALSTR